MTFRKHHVHARGHEQKIKLIKESFFLSFFLSTTCVLHICTADMVKYFNSDIRIYRDQTEYHNAGVIKLYIILVITVPDYK